MKKVLGTNNRAVVILNTKGVVDVVLGDDTEVLVLNYHNIKKLGLEKDLFPEFNELIPNWIKKHYIED